jgi:hypothetical protein
MPPSEGFEELLHLTVTSFLFLIPRFRENLSNIKLTTSDIISAPVKNSM